MRLEKWPCVNRSLQLDKINGQNRGACQRKVRSFWSNGFSASIILPDRTLRPGRKLQGKVMIHSKALVTFTGLRVQLDAQSTLFLEKNGELVTKRFSILQTENNNGGGGGGGGGVNSNSAQSNNNSSSSSVVNGNNKKSVGMQGNQTGSGIHCDAVEWLGNSKEIYALIPDINSVVDALTFPFSLEVPGDRAFPCPFNNTIGTLVYKLSAHLCSQDLRYAQIAEEALDFKGYANLSNNLSETGKPISIERPLALPPSPLTPSIASSSSSIASYTSSQVSASFTVESSGFLPEEAVHFTLYVKNPRKLPMHMKVIIAQKVTYGISETCWKKINSSVVRCERVEVNLGGGDLAIGETGELIWRGALIIPKGQVPSFSCVVGYPCYGVMYNIQFKVEGLDHDWTLKGSAPLFIGTCRNNIFHGRLITG